MLVLVLVLVLLLLARSILPLRLLLFFRLPALPPQVLRPQLSVLHFPLLFLAMHLPCVLSVPSRPLCLSVQLLPVRFLPLMDGSVLCIT